MAVVALLAVGACSGETAAITTTSTDTSTTTSTTLAPDPAIDGPVMRVGLLSNLTTTNWWAAMGPQSTPENRAVVASTKASLFTLSYPGFALVPSLAATATPEPVTQQGSTWVVNQPLRDDVFWSDGEHLTAEDIVFYFDVVREFDLEGSHAEHFPAAVVDVSAVDELTIQVEFDALPSLTAWQTGVAMAPAVPSHFWAPHVDQAREVARGVRSDISEDEAREALAAASLADEDSENDQTPESVSAGDVGAYVADAAAEAGRNHLYSVESPMEPSAGSQVFESWEAGDLAITRSNPDYFARGTETTQYSDGSVRVADPELGDNVYGGSASGEIEGHAVVGPFVSGIEWVEHVDEDAAYEALATGEVDFVLDAEGMSLSRYNELVGHGGVGLSISEAHGFRYLGLNLRKPPMSDPTFRNALATVIDKELFASSLFNGTLFPAYSIVHPGLASQHNDEVSRPGWANGEPMTESERFEAAIAALADAGYTWDVEPEISFDESGIFVGVAPGEGLTMPNGVAVPPLVILAAPGSADDPMRATFALWIEQWMTDLGMDVSTDLVDLASIGSAVVSPDSLESALSWDIHVLGWGLHDASLPGLTLAALFHSGNAVDTGGLNTTGYASSDFDEAADSFVSSTSLEEAARWTKEMERIISQDLPYITLYRDPVIEGFGSHVEFAVDAIMGGHASLPMSWPETVRITRR